MMRFDSSSLGLALAASALLFGCGSDAEECPESGTPVQRNGRLRVEGTQLVNQCGEPVQLKGTSSMWLNWDGGDYATNKNGLQYMRDHWNMSVFRAAMGVDPGPGQGGYLEAPEENEEKIHTIVQNAIDLGVYVVIDWHDHHAEDHQAEAEEFFATMAETYKDVPNVLYEVYNEPLRVSWRNVLKPYHEALVSTIRAIDPHNVIILGTGSWSQDVDDAAADPVAGANLMYTLHFYSGTHTGWLRNRSTAAIEDGLPLMVTEWGASHADGGTDGELHLDEARLWHDWMDEHSIGWMAWKYDGCQDTTCFFVDRQASPDGGWTDADLNGHAPFVIDRMQN